MAVVVKIDQVKDASGRRMRDRNGQYVWELVRNAVVSGLGEGSYGSELLVIEAVDEVIAITGDIGSPFPGRSICKLEDFEPEVLSQTSVRVRIVYRDLVFAPCQIEVGTSLSQVETNLDKNGNKITLEYTFPAGYKNGAYPAGETIPQGGMYTKLVPEATAVFRRFEDVSPLVKSTQYTGKVNSTTFLGMAAGYVLCTSITGRSEDGGVTFDVTYEFQIRADAWTQKLIYINPDDGKPPTDLVDNVGMKTIVVYEEADFDALALDEAAA